MFGRFLVTLSVFICLTEAVVEFPFSKIYDEYDFKGKSTVVINDLCAESCRIYASISPDSKKFAANLLIQLPKGFSSIADVAAKVDATTGQKLFLEISGNPSLSIVNANANLAAGPLVLYVVNSAEIIHDTDFVQPEVYEAEGLLRPVSTIPRYVTVMSARPFTLHGAPLPDLDAQGVIATMSGFDSMEDGYCPNLYFTISPESFPGFVMEVNGPIITLEYDFMDFDYPPGELTATIGISNMFDGAFSRNGWVGSPGFHGCPGLAPYRSSLYDSFFATPFHAQISNFKELVWDVEMTIGVDVVTNTDAAHALTLKEEDSGAKFSVSDVPAKTHIGRRRRRTKLQNISISWISDGTGNTHFLARWRAYQSHIGQNF